MPDFRSAIEKIRYRAAQDRGVRRVLALPVGIAFVVYGALGLTAELKPTRYLVGTVLAYEIDAEAGELYLTLKGDDGEHVSARSRMSDVASESLSPVKVGDRVHLRGRFDGDEFLIYDATAGARTMLDEGTSRKWAIGRALTLVLLGLAAIGVTWLSVEFHWAARPNA